MFHLFIRGHQFFFTKRKIIIVPTNRFVDRKISPGSCCFGLSIVWAINSLQETSSVGGLIKLVSIDGLSKILILSLHAICSISTLDLFNFLDLLVVCLCCNYLSVQFYVFTPGCKSDPPAQLVTMVLKLKQSLVLKRKFPNVTNGKKHSFSS